MERESLKHKRAKKRIEKIKGFYNHLGVYLVINTLLQIFYSGAFDTDTWLMETPIWARFITPVSWGIGLTIHGLVAFKGYKIKNLWKGWEDRKIKEFMEEEDQKRSTWK